jgi:hypothetical protein
MTRDIHEDMSLALRKAGPILVMAEEDALTLFAKGFPARRRRVDQTRHAAVAARMGARILRDAPALFR